MKNLVLVFIIVSFFASCRKSDNISDIPHITFVSLTTIKNANLKDSVAVVDFDYEDGDGDLGQLDTDTNTAYRNLFINFFEKKNGVFTEVITPLDFNATIPNLTPKAKNKAISGNIKHSAIGLPINVVNDTIKLYVYIIDRADHKSNIIETSELVITTQ